MHIHLLEVSLLFYFFIAFFFKLGTKYFDDNWFYSGVAERKLTHIMDFIDCAIFLK